MEFDQNSERPIFLQVADEIEDSIFTGIFEEEMQIPSTNDISALWKINPHTVLKGMNVLVEQDIIYKKRGLGMFVTQGAVRKIKEKRQDNFYVDYVVKMLEEARKLGMNHEEIIALIEREDKE